jgi:hypothetical protein
MAAKDARAMVAKAGHFYQSCKSPEPESTLGQATTIKKTTLATVQI